MSHSWPLVRLGDVLTLQRRWLVPELDRQYVEIGVRSFGRGIFHKAPVTGAELGNKRVLRIEPGDLVLMNVFAWEGAVAVASQAEAGMIGSHRYATYMADRERCIPEFLNLYFKTETGLELLRRVSPGSAGRNRTLNLAQFIQQAVPLPAVEEQRRIVSHLDAIAAKVEQAQRLRREANGELDVLRERIINSLLQGSDWPIRSLKSLLREPSRNGLSRLPASTPPGYPILRISAATSRLDARIDETDHRFLEIEESAAEKYSLRAGDLLACRFNGNLRFVGRFALYEGASGQKHVYPDKLIRFRLHREEADPRFVARIMNSGPVRRAVEELCATTAGNIGISAGRLQEVELPVPPLAEQQRMVDQIERAERLLGAARAEQALASQGLQILLPRVLAQALGADQ